MADIQKKYWTDDPDLVEKYVLGKLTDEERKRLDDEIAYYKPGKEKIRREMQFAAGIRRHGRDQLKSRLRLKLRREQSQQIFRYQMIGLAAAVVVIAIGVGVYQVWFSEIAAPKKFNNQEIVLKQTDSTNNESKPGEESVAGESKDEGKLQKRSMLKPTSQREAIVSSQGASVKKDVATAPSKQGFAKTEDQVSEIEESSEPVKPKRSIPTQSIWLIGKVVMIEDQKPTALSDTQHHALMSEQSEEKRDHTSEQRSKRITIKRGETEGQIMLQQRSFRELPRSRQTQIGKKNVAETLVQQSDEGLSLTIYSDAISAAEIKNATIEIAGSDSIIVETGSQRIYYKLPASFQQQTRTRR